MDQKLAKNKIKQLIIEITELEMSPDEIKDDDLLLGGNFGLDSLSIVTLIAGLEKEFNIIIGDDEIKGELFESVDSMDSFVQSKMQ